MTPSQSISPRLWNRNFTMVVIGQIISIFGNVILRFALNVYVLSLTGSAAVFGTVMALSIIPQVVLGPVGGILADRVNRRNIMVALDFVTAGLLLLFGLTLSPGNAVPLIATLLMLLAVISSFYTPAVQSSIPLLQTGDNLVRGNAIVNQVNMIANLLGPVLGGMVYGLFGVGPVIWVAVACFAASALLEVFIHIPYTPLPRAGGLLSTVKQDFSASLDFVVRRQPDILKMLLTLMAVNLFLSPMINVGHGYMVMTVLGFDSGMYGLSSSLMGAGGLAGGLLAGLLAGRVRTRSIYKLLVAVPIGLVPIAIAFMVGAPALATFVVIAVCITLCMVLVALFDIFAISALQQCIPTDMLGKVYALVTTASMAASPIGNAMYGLIFDTFTGHIPLIILATVVVTALIGLMTKRPCATLESWQAENREGLQPAA